MTTILMCAKCGGCAVYGNGKLCLFCEDGVPCDCQKKRKKSSMAIAQPKKPTKAKKADRANEAARRGKAHPWRGGYYVPPEMKEQITEAVKRPVKLKGFAAHLDCRMRQHREWQEETTAELVHDFINIAWVVFQEIDRRNPRRRQRFELEGPAEIRG